MTVYKHAGCTLTYVQRALRIRPIGYESTCCLSTKEKQVHVQ